MKTLKRLTLAGLGAWMVVSPAPAAEGPSYPDLPALSGARVTIPYAELAALWEAARQQQDARLREARTKPPMKAVVRSAEYELRLTASAATLEARYLVRTLVPGWQLVPLLGGEARLESSDTGEDGIVRTDGCYCLLTRREGEHEVRLTLTAGSLERLTTGLQLHPAPATLNRLKITGLPEGLAVRIAGLAPTTLEEGSATYHLPGEGRELALTLEPYEAPEPPALPAPPPPLTPSTWDIQSEVFVRYDEGRLFYQTRVFCQADEGSGVAMELRIPHNALHLSVEGEDLGESRLGPRLDDRRPLHIEWKTRETLDRTFELSYEIPQSPLAGQWLLQAPEVTGDGSTRSLFAIQAVDGLELNAEALRDSVQSRRLPQWLRERTGPNEFLTAEADSVLPVTTTWLPRIQTAQAMVSKATYTTRLVADGALLVTAGFTVQHQGPLAWRLKLPTIDEVLTCEVNGSAAQPVKRGTDEIEFSLPPSKEGSSQIALCFAARTEAFDPVSGRLELELPMTGLFIHELTWILTIPEEYEAQIQGNVTIDRSAATKNLRANVIPLRKELLRGEHPAVEIHYQRRGLRD